MKIQGNKGTWYSMVLAIIIYVGTFALAYYLGEQRAEIKIYSQQTEQILSQQNNNNQVINSVVFQCIDNKSIRAIFFRDKVELSLSDQRNMVLMQAISASGARYANTDESIVFWNKGDTAFIQEGDVTTYENCVVVPAESAE